MRRRGEEKAEPLLHCGLRLGYCRLRQVGACVLNLALGLTAIVHISLLAMSAFEVGASPLLFNESTHVTTRARRITGGSSSSFCRGNVVPTITDTDAVR